MMTPTQIFVESLMRALKSHCAEKGTSFRQMILKNHTAKYETVQTNLKRNPTLDYVMGVIAACEADSLTILTRALELAKDISAQNQPTVV